MADFDKLPKSIVGLIVNYLSVKERARFGRTCKKYKIYAPGLSDLVKYHKKIIKIVDAVCDDKHASLCRICFRFGKNDEYCRSCNNFACYNCVFWTDSLCEFCRKKVQCTDCGEKAYATCIGCEKAKCENHVTYFKVGALQCTACREN